VTTRRKKGNRQKRNKPTSLKKRVTILAAWYGAAVLLSVGVGVGHYIVETHKRLEMVQGELGRINQRAMQEGARRAELEVTARHLIQELNRAGSERDELKVQLEQAVSKLEQLSGDVKEAEAAYRDGLGRLEILRAELNDAKQSAHKAEERAAAAETQAASLQWELNIVKADRDALQTASESASDIARLRASLNEAESRVAEMQLRLKVAQSDLEVSKQGVIEAKEKAAEFEDQAAKLLSELEMRKAELDGLRKELDEAKSSLETKSPRPERRRTRLSVDPEARDYLIKTLVFEAAGETEIGKIAVAYVVLNRQRIGRWGDKIKDVVTHPWQFEPWMTRRDEIEKLSPQDHRYQDAAEIVEAVLAGRIPDPTAGATHFLNPVVVRKRRGGSLPSWADVEGKPIGRHVFYSPRDVRQQIGGVQRYDFLGAG
jgi:N-acetylmuramoyl-L-alanine amidase